MSRGLICDQCGAVLPVDDRGDDENGESSVWLILATRGGPQVTFDLCTRSCLVALVEADDFAAAMEARLEAVAEVVRALQEDDGSDPGGADAR